MSRTNYLSSIRSALTKAYSFNPDLDKEGPTRPIVELRKPIEFLYDDIVLTNGSEKCLIESSSNSLRISFLFKFEDSDLVDKILGRKFSSFFMKRSDDLVIFRRKPLDGFSVSFLLLSSHTIILASKEKVIDLIIRFVEEVDKEVSALKLDINKSSRMIATTFLKQFQ
jgi:actin related protein 2/3 complex subunit 4